MPRQSTTRRQARTTRKTPTRRRAPSNARTARKARTARTARAAPSRAKSVGRRAVSTLRGRRWTGILEDLHQDHQKVRGLLAQLTETEDDGERRRLFEECDREIVMHSRIEEEAFYPAFRDAADREEDREMYYEAVEEHHAVDRLLEEMRDGDESSDKFCAQCKVLKELVEHHADEEEREMFPHAAKVLGNERLEAIGEEGRRLRQSGQVANEPYASM